MKLLDRLFGKTIQNAHQADQATCLHPTLAPMWESVEEMGERDRISRYRCAECQALLSGDQGRVLLRERRSQEIAA